jgi:pimeloyl-ACP methyl ester carboxylesterase
MHQIDISHLAPHVRVPTLIVHPRGDQAVPFEEGRLLASLLPRAQFVPLESRNHLVTKQEPAWARLVEAMRAFLAEPDSVA